MKKDRFSLLDQVTIFVELSGMERVIHAFRLACRLIRARRKIENLAPCYLWPITLS